MDCPYCRVNTGGQHEWGCPCNPLTPEKPDEPLANLRAFIHQDCERRIHRLESQIKELEAQRDEAGRRYVEQVQECTDKQTEIDELRMQLAAADEGLRQGPRMQVWLRAEAAEKKVKELEAELAKGNDALHENCKLRTRISRLEEVVNNTYSQDQAALMTDNARLRECLKIAEDLIHDVYLQCPDENEWVNKAESWLEKVAELKEGE